MGKSCCKGKGNKADAWTNISAVGEMVSSFVSDAYWLATLTDLMGDLDAEELGLSYWGLGTGALIALLTASGAAYCHWNLNKINQKKKTGEGAGTHHSTSEEGHDHDHNHSCSSTDDSINNSDHTKNVVQNFVAV